MSVDGDSSQAQNDKADGNGNDGGNVDGLVLKEILRRLRMTRLTKTGTMTLMLMV